MLKKIGIVILYKLFVSLDLRKRKDVGIMWEYIKKLVNEKGLFFIYVGDNVCLDV